MGAVVLPVISVLLWSEELLLFTLFNFCLFVVWMGVAVSKLLHANQSEKNMANQKSCCRIFKRLISLLLVFIMYITERILFQDVIQVSS